MSKPRHAVQSNSRKRSVWVAVVALLVLGLVSAGFWFSSQSNPQPAPTPTVTATPSPSPTVTSTPEPTPTETPTPTLNENEISLRVYARGTDHRNNYHFVMGWVNGSEDVTRYKVDKSLYFSFTEGHTFIVTVSNDEPDGVPQIISIR